MRKSQKMRRKVAMAEHVKAATAKLDKKIKAKAGEVQACVDDHVALKDKQRTLIDEMRELQYERDAVGDAARTDWRDEHKNAVVA